MRAITKLMAGAAAVLAMAATSAQAAVYISFDGATDAFTQGDGAFFFNASNIGGFETVNVLGDTGVVPALLHSQQVDVNSNGGAASITVYVTHTDIDGPMPLYGYLSSFASNNSRNGFTVTMSTYADASNGLYGGTLLSTASYTGQGSDSDNEIYAGALAPSANPYSVTHKYVITDTGVGNGSTSPSITMSAAVPEPGTWALMIMGFGGAGAMLRSRRRQAVVA